jgi:hypothetical protein
MGRNYHSTIRDAECLKAEYSSPFFHRDSLNNLDAHPTKDYAWKIEFKDVGGDRGIPGYDHYSMKLYFHTENSGDGLVGVFESYSDHIAISRAEKEVDARFFRGEKIGDWDTLYEKYRTMPVDRYVIGQPLVDSVAAEPTKYPPCPLILKTSDGDVMFLPDGTFHLKK